MHTDRTNTAIKYLCNQISAIKYRITTIDLALPAEKVYKGFFLFKQPNECMLTSILLTNRLPRLLTSCTRIEQTLPLAINCVR